MATDLKCPYCGCTDLEVTGGRPHSAQNKCVRYRRCENKKCGKKLTSEEFGSKGKRISGFVEMDDS